MNNKATLYLRLAGIEDAELLLSWANDPQTRRNSLNSETISMETHLEWLHNSLADVGTTIYILMENQTPVGQIRFVAIADTATIHYSIDENKRGMGYGISLVAMGCEKLLHEKPAIHAFRALVKVQNVASQVVFEKNGFVIEKRDGEHFIFAKLIEACGEREMNESGKIITPGGGARVNK